MTPFWRSAGGRDHVIRRLVEFSARPWTCRGAALGAVSTSHVHNQYDTWGSTMTAADYDDQLGEIYPTMLNGPNCTFGVSFFSRFHCCGRHGHGLWPSWYRPWHIRHELKSTTVLDTWQSFTSVFLYQAVDQVIHTDNGTCQTYRSVLKLSATN